MVLRQAITRVVAMPERPVINLLKGEAPSLASPGVCVQPVQVGIEPSGAQLSGWLFPTVVDGEMWTLPAGGPVLSFVLP